MKLTWTPLTGDFASLRMFAIVLSSSSNIGSDPMFDELDSTIATILNDAKSPVKGVHVSFITPDKDFKATEPTINLFLYDVKENRDLREDRKSSCRERRKYS